MSITVINIWNVRKTHLLPQYFIAMSQDAHLLTYNSLIQDLHCQSTVYNQETLNLTNRSHIGDRLHEQNTNI